VDIEWVCDGEGFWALQARPITTLTEAPHRSANRPRLWTRANLKEVFPELPSPLALSYLTFSLNRMFQTYHAAHGYSVAPDSRLVSVIRGRPYLNLSLMQQMTVERGGDPAIVGRLFGGASPTEPKSLAPASHPEISITARARLGREMLATLFSTPYRGRRLFHGMRRQAVALADISLEALDDRALSAHADEFFATCWTRPPCAACTRWSPHSLVPTCSWRPHHGVGADRCRRRPQAADDRARYAAQRTDDLSPHGSRRARRAREPGPRYFTVT